MSFIKRVNCRDVIYNVSQYNRDNINRISTIIFLSLYKNKYRIESTRLDVWDYSKYRYYFITVCTREKKCFFGNADEDKVLLNKFGEIVRKIWFQIPKQFDDVELDEFVIMPNHLHGIIFISRDAIHRVSTGIGDYVIIGDAINSVSTDKRKTGLPVRKIQCYTKITYPKLFDGLKGEQHMRFVIH